MEGETDVESVVKELLRACHHLTPELTAMWQKMQPPPATAEEGAGEEYKDQ